MKSNRLDGGEKLYTAAQIRNIELNYAKMTSSGTYPLMEAAGVAAYQQIKKMWPDAGRILILTGKGNNGGDGFVIARLAKLDNKSVTLSNFCPQDNIKGDALKAFQALPEKGIDKIDPSQISLAYLDKFDLIIDAMLGTGLSGPVREPMLGIIQLINQLDKIKTAIVAIDIPSGLDADNGICYNQVINADATLTFIGHKRGLYTGESANYRGRVKLLKLDVPEVCFLSETPQLVSENLASLKSLFKPRKATAHKGDFGHCLVIGGCEQMTGAAILSAKAAARSGCGLTSARLESGASSLLILCPEVMAKNVATELIAQQQQKVSTVDSVVVGPGLGKDHWASEWMLLLSNNQLLAGKVKVWDADALNWLAQHPDFDDYRILTPHPGEAGRLLSCSTEQINNNRFAASQQIAQKYGGICVLKGSGTIISDANGNQIVCAVGNPGMASGGMGDVLSGIIGSLLAQGFSLMNAAALGVSIHGEAADRAAGLGLNYRGMLASDLFKFLPELLNP